MAEPDVIDGYNVCAWPTDPACFTTAWDALDDDVKDRALALAISALHRLSGYQVGGCPITVRPCNRVWSPLTPNDWVVPYQRGPYINSSGEWVNCAYTCGFATGAAVRLPAPVGEIYEVKIDGDVVDPSEYHLSGTLLIRNEGTWPTGQNLALPDTEDNTFSIRYLNSYVPDGLAAYAVALLAMEFAKACTDDKTCKLPSTVRQVTRQGVSFNLAQGLFPDGLTGIREVDVWVKTYNPDGLRQRTAVYSPDTGW